MNNKGQLSIFMAVSVVFFITAVAFVINVGLFVKAKINLQNSVDAAAYSGAAVQARQLTDIAYLNYEMRNIYKEWMFKYYVLGNLSAEGVQNPGQNRGYARSPGMDFTIKSANGIQAPASASDRYNLPSVCIQVGNKNSYCSLYYIPGLPRLSNQFIFEDGITQIGKELEDALASTKASYCTKISQLNMLVATNWAYGLGENINDQINTQVPNIVQNRPGAFPKALELSMRIRSLEAMVNFEPKQNVQASDLINLRDLGSERVVKAFYSAYRNLGGHLNTELKESFTLTELSPRQLIQNEQNNLSNLLIPPGNARTKRFLDLKLTPINYAPFYSLLVPKSDQVSGTDAACEMTRVALPVPAYPFGFEKNPEVLTYYAVKGEAQFNGLFNPFRSNGIKLTAYAMAKPFGGRIGPKLFSTNNPTYVTPRSSNQTNSWRSSAYILGLKPNNRTATVTQPVIPYDANFWVQNQDDRIGGIESTGNIKYVIPNMHYEPASDSSLYYDRNIYAMELPLAGAIDYQIGLYNSNQFELFKNNLETSSGLVNKRNIEEAISKLRLPTNYEAKNYLIPTAQVLNEKLRLDSFGLPDNEFNIFAPLYGPNSIYEDTNNVLVAIADYIKSQEPSIQAYQGIMKDTADKVRNQLAANGEDRITDEAANKIYDSPLTCNSIAGGFSYYYMGAQSGVDESKGGCRDPFFESLRNYFSNKVDPNFYREPGFEDQRFKIVDENQSVAKNSKLFSAYFPGPLAGNGPQGEIKNPFTSIEEGTYSLRNSYSTKLISFKSFFEGAFSRGNYSEARGNNSKTSGQNIINTIDRTTIDTEQIFQ